jgi:hypothetical protein
MNLIVDLLTTATDSHALDDSITENIRDIECYVHQRHSYLCQDIWDVDDSITLASSLLRDLDFNKPANTIFLTTLLDYAERFKLQTSFQILYSIAQQNNITLGSRHLATYLFLLTVQVRSDHIKIYDKIVTSLQLAFEEEEDDDINVLVTFSNYLLNVIGNTAVVDPSIIQNILTRTVMYRQHNHSFLDKPFITEIVNTFNSNPGGLEAQIKNQIEHVLTVDYIQLFSGNTRLIEANTQYEMQIRGITPNFTSIRQYAFGKFNELDNNEKRAIMNNLQRGVKIIDDENSLYAYLTLYGKKHYIKLLDVLEHLPDLPKHINVIDWACGQALGSIVFAEHIQINHLDCSIGSILLVEPSLPSLERAALHTSIVGETESCSTVHKDMDSLTNNDFVFENDLPFVHIFSNILDVETFDIGNIQTLIDNNFSGSNIFIITSPYINDKKRNRIQMFVNRFSDKYPDTFEYLYERDSKGTDPTMVNRIFKIII